MSRDQIEKAFAAALKAHKSPGKAYLLEKVSKNNRSEVIISFPGSGAVKDWYSEKPFGEAKVNIKLFPSLRSVGNDEAALVNDAFQKRFENILAKSSLASESTKARLCLRAAGELEERRSNNEDRMKKKKDFVEKTMKELEKYKETWEHQKVGYYDAFKVQEDPEDFQANVKRLELANVWDEIIEMLRRYELPDEFEGNAEWVKLGTRLRRLVEPLDIANYYRHLRHHGSRPYLTHGRPGRYRYTQRWVEHAQRGSEEKISESSFWAEVEDLCNIASNNNGSIEDVRERVMQLEAQIKTWIEKGQLGRDVFLEGSTLVKWWKGLPLEHKQESCIKSLIEA